MSDQIIALALQASAEAEVIPAEGNTNKEDETK